MQFAVRFAAVRRLGSPPPARSLVPVFLCRRPSAQAGPEPALRRLRAGDRDRLDARPVGRGAGDDEIADRALGAAQPAGARDAVDRAVASEVVARVSDRACFRAMDDVRREAGQGGLGGGDHRLGERALLSLRIRARTQRLPVVAARGGEPGARFVVGHQPDDADSRMAGGRGARIDLGQHLDADTQVDEVQRRAAVGNIVDAEVDHERRGTRRGGGEAIGEIGGQRVAADELEERAPDVGVRDDRARRDAPAVGERDADRAAVFDEDALDARLQLDRAAARLDRFDQDLSEALRAAGRIIAAVEIIAEQRHHLGAVSRSFPSLT